MAKAWAQYARAKLYNGAPKGSWGRGREKFTYQSRGARWKASSRLLLARVEEEEEEPVEEKEDPVEEEEEQPGEEEEGEEEPGEEDEEEELGEREEEMVGLRCLLDG